MSPSCNWPGLVTGLSGCEQSPAYRWIQGRRFGHSTPRGAPSCFVRSDKSASAGGSDSQKHPQNPAFAMRSERWSIAMTLVLGAYFQGCRRLQKRPRVPVRFPRKEVTWVNLFISVNASRKTDSSAVPHPSSRERWCSTMASAIFVYQEMLNSSCLNATSKPSLEVLWARSSDAR